MFIYQRVYKFFGPKPTSSYPIQMIQHIHAIEKTGEPMEKQRTFPPKQPKLIEDSGHRSLATKHLFRLHRFRIRTSRTSRVLGGAALSLATWLGAMAAKSSTYGWWISSYEPPVIEFVWGFSRIFHVWLLEGTCVRTSSNLSPCSFIMLHFSDTLNSKMFQTPKQNSTNRRLHSLCCIGSPNVGHRHSIFLFNLPPPRWIWDAPQSMLEYSNNREKKKAP